MPVQEKLLQYLICGLPSTFPSLLPAKIFQIGIKYHVERFKSRSAENLFSPTLNAGLKRYSVTVFTDLLTSNFKNRD